MTQTKAILEHLKSGRTITPIEALERFGCFRLGARCYDLKQQGYAIKTRMVEGPNGKHWAEYRLDDA